MPPRLYKNFIEFYHTNPTVAIAVSYREQFVQTQYSLDVSLNLFIAVKPA